MTPEAAASMVGIIGLINGGGRIAWSTVSDYIGRRSVYVLFFIIEIAAFYLLAQTANALLFQILVFVIISCYGGGFSCMPAYLSDLFGTKELSAIHGKILTAWGLAGIAAAVILHARNHQRLHGNAVRFCSGICVKPYRCAYFKMAHIGGCGDKKAVIVYLLY